MNDSTVRFFAGKGIAPPAQACMTPAPWLLRGIFHARSYPIAVNYGNVMDRLRISDVLLAIAALVRNAG